jgi:hypothetical protein
MLGSYTSGGLSIPKILGGPFASATKYFIQVGARSLVTSSVSIDWVGRTAQI